MPQEVRNASTDVSCEISRPRGSAAPHPDLPLRWAGQSGVYQGLREELRVAERTQSSPLVPWSLRMKSLPPTHTHTHSPESEALLCNT